ncbi:MAG: hypothetical protein IJT94_11250, partial [Oscillibacter sp.]|nr:hypothetical protein [Oscillibacter sp.]
MKKNLSRVLAFLLSLVMCAGMLPTGVLAASVPGITEVTYYGKNPDTSVEGEMANYPAVTVTFNGGSTNLEVFS